MRYVIVPLLLLAVAGVAGTTAASPAGTNAAATFFEERCAKCHGRDGRARTELGRELGAADLTRSKLAAPEVARAVRSGRGRMNAPAPDATAEQQRAVAEYAKSLREMLESIDTGDLLKK